MKAPGSALLLCSLSQPLPGTLMLSYEEVDCFASSLSGFSLDIWMLKFQEHFWAQNSWPGTRFPLPVQP